MLHWCQCFLSMCLKVNQNLKYAPDSGHIVTFLPLIFSVQPQFIYLFSLSALLSLSVSHSLLSLPLSVCGLGQEQRIVGGGGGVSLKQSQRELARMLL